MSLKDVLSHPHVWRGRADDSLGVVTVPTGLDELDRYLPRGGWPLGAVTEIVLERYGVGELSLLMPALSYLSTAAVRRWIVWVAPPFVPYAPALRRCGLDLDRVLLVHPSGEKGSALWATEQAVRSRSSAVVLAWLGTADTTALRRIQLSAEEHVCWTVLFRPLSALTESSPAALRMKLSQAPAGSMHTAFREADRIQIDILKCRGRRPMSISIDNSALRERVLGGSGWQ